MKFNCHFALIVLVSMIITPSICSATDLPHIKPEKVGVSSQRLGQIDDLTRHYVDRKKVAGIVTMIARHGKIVHTSAAGQYGLDNEKPMDTDTLFRIFSMTKPVTAVAAMILYEEGKFQMNDPVRKHLPEFEHQMLLRDDQLVPPATPMTMRQLFTHTAGLTYGFTPDNPVDNQYNDTGLLRSADLTVFSHKLAALPLRFEPGTRYHYSVSMDLLGAAIERISGQPLDVFFRERIFKPLEMSDTFFSVPAEKRHRLASSHTWNSELNQIELVPEERQRNYDQVTFFSGGGGLVSSISDYMRFCEMLRNGGSLDRVRILGPKTVEYMTSDHLTPTVRAAGVGQYPSQDLYPGQSMALGFGLIVTPGIGPSISSVRQLSWGGIAGTKFWIDPAEGVIGIAMVQLYRSPWLLRDELKVAAYQALTELSQPHPVRPK